MKCYSDKIIERIARVAYETERFFSESSGLDGAVKPWAEVTPEERQSAIEAARSELYGTHPIKSRVFLACVRAMGQEF